MPYESLPVVRSVRNVLRKASSSDEAITGVLEAVGDSMGWLVGAFWAPEDAQGGDGTLVSRCVWAARIHKGAAFARETGQLHLPPGAGLPGQVMTRGETVWIEDVGEHPDFPSAAAVRISGLHAAVGFPVQHEGRILGVLEFFTDVLRAPVEALLPVFDALGREIGAFMARQPPSPPPPRGDAGPPDEELRARRTRR
jgi:GAF domain-containing protein